MVTSGDAFDGFLQSTFPQWKERLITPGFEFDDKKLGRIRGYPRLARHMLGDKPPPDPDDSKEWRKTDQWTKEGIAQLAEYKVFELMRSKFLNEPSLVIANFHEKNICKLAQDTFTYSSENDPLSEQVIFESLIFYKTEFN